MKKRLLSVLTVIFILLCLAACDSKTPAPKASNRPTGWNENVEMLRMLNGVYHATTAEELNAFVPADTIQQQKDKFIKDMNQILGDQQMLPDHRNYDYDTVKLTLLESDDGYEVFWVEAQSTALTLAYQTYFENPNAPQPAKFVSMNILRGVYVVTIENDHYVLSMDEDLTKRVQKKYDYCDDCHGQGCFYNVEFCEICLGAGVILQGRCGGCGTPADEFVELPMEEDIFVGTAEEAELDVGSSMSVVSSADNPQLDLSQNTQSNGVCPNCNGVDVVYEEIPCTVCNGIQETNREECATCLGKGWIKK